MSNRRQRSARFDTAVLFAALGDRTRLDLVNRLSNGAPLSISRLAVGTDLTRQAITKHLSVLREAGVVSMERQGRESLYRLEARPIAHLRTELDAISRQWEDALCRLKVFVEHA